MSEYLKRSVSTCCSCSNVSCVVARQMNLTMGIFVALVGFLWSIWEVILSYGADPWKAATFFAFCVVCGANLPCHSL